MKKTFRSARRFAALAVATLALGLSACSDDDHGHEVEVDFMRITVGAQEVTVNSTGAVTGGTLSLSQNVATDVSVEFLDAAMADALEEHADDFQVTITPGAGITFARTGPFAGTLTGTSVGVVSVSFSLLHIEEAHEDFGPFPVNITVNAPPVAK